MIVVPGYYKKFKCIADRCKHNCCIGWEIDIDEDTLDYYNQIGINKIEYEDNVPHFKLVAGNRCPYLLENGLCEIISHYGVDALCDICADHPRFRNFYENFIEIGLGLCCEEAARIILCEKAQFSLVAENGEISLLPEEESMLLERNNIFKIIQNRKNNICKRLSELADKYGYRLEFGSMNKVCDTYLSLERLDDSWTDALNGLLRFSFSGIIFNEKHLETAFEQLLCYFVFRHFPGGIEDGKYEQRMRLAISGCFLIAALCEKHLNDTGSISLKQITEFARMYSGEIEYSEDNINSLINVL